MLLLETNLKEAVLNFFSVLILRGDLFVYLWQEFLCKNKYVYIKVSTLFKNKSVYIKNIHKSKKII